jgi:hypothetical protein
VVKNLFDCLSGVRPYTLNKAAVIAHDVNLRVDEINKLFAAIGIEQICERIRQTDALLDWFINSKELDGAPEDGVSKTLVEERIKEIVDRRNEIAHGGDIPADLPGESTMSDAIGFVRAFAQSIFTIVVGSYLKAHHNPKLPGCIELMQREGDGPFKNGTVVVVEKPAERLFIGQPVFVQTASIGARWGRIKSLRVDDTDMPVVGPEADALQGIGVGLDFKCPKGATLVALEAEDDIVWSPPQSANAPTA